MNDETMRRAITAIAEGLRKAGDDLSTIADTGDLVNELGENLLRIAGEVEDIETTAALQDAFNSPIVPRDEASAEIKARAERVTLASVERELETVIGERDALIAECSAALEGREAVRESLVDTLGEVDDALETAAAWAIVDRLPKTADGVPVVPGRDTVFHPDGINGSHGREIEFRYGTWRAGRHLVFDCYSTREAAAESAGGASCT